MIDKCKLVIAAGAFRSGSTWLFNAIRLVLNEKSNNIYACWVGDYDASKALNCEYVLVKIHSKSEEWCNSAGRIFTIHRDLRDVARSAIDFVGAQTFEEVMPLIRGAAKDHDFWQEFCHADYDFQSISTSSEYIVKDIATNLDIDLSQEKVSFISDRLKNLKEPVDSNNYDPVTLLHPKHRFDGMSSTWSRRITAEQSDLIMKEFSSWMNARGYR